MTDPHFTKRADLEAWAVDQARKAQAKVITGGSVSGMLATVNNIRRVTLAHKHLED